MGSVHPHYCAWCGRKFHSEAFYINKHFGMFIPFAKEFCSPRCRSHYSNQKRRDDNYQPKTKQKEEPAPRRPKKQNHIETEYVQPKPTVEPKRTKEDIDLEFYERQKQLEFQQFEERLLLQQQEKIAQQKQENFDNAKEYLAKGGNKSFYYFKLLWAYLDKPWKKVAFILLLWAIIASIFGELDKFLK